MSKEISPIEEYFCPNCSAVLNEQDGFEPLQEIWTCKKCGQVLCGDTYHGEKFPGVLWFCDKCNSFLNSQSAFKDTDEVWVCTECGHSNAITKEAIEKTPIKVKMVGAWEKAKPILKNVAKWTAIVGSVVVAAAFASKENNSENEDEKDLGDTEDFLTVENDSPKYKIVMQYSDGTSEEEDEIFDSEESAEEYAQYLVGCSREGAETLNLSNPGDYPMDDFDDPDFEIIQIDT